MHQEYHVIVSLFRQMSRVVTMKMIVLFALGLSLATIGLARADVEWCDVEIDPDNPISTDPVTMILSGWWGNSCVPNNSAVSVIGKDIYFDVIWDYPPFISCLTMITGWTLADLVGPLPPGTYTVYARVVGYPLPDPPQVYEQVADFIVSDNQPPRILYVDANAPGANNGTSWENAYFYLQDALMFAVGGDEIRVAQGVYKPDDFVLSDRPSRGREETFQLVNGLALKGGYAGVATPDPNARDTVLYETVLSGDLDGNDAPVIDPEELRNESTRAENSFHVVTADGTEIVPSTVLDGFTITGGNANGAWEEGNGDGGGILCYQSSPSIMNCVIHGNSAGYLGHGGGMINLSGSPTLTNCTFRGNLADRYGGGMLNYLGSATLVECRFIGNTTRSAGGGVLNWSSEVSLTKCVLSGNSASKDSGGGMLSDDSSVTLRNCVFSGNWSRRNGGGLYIYDKTARLSNCTFSGNSAGGRGGGIYNYSGYAELGGCIVWGNLDSEIDGSAVATYSDIEGGLPGEGNMDTDPCFAEAGYWDTNGTPDDANDDFWVDGDYHLKSQGGRWDANEGRWTIDEVTSLCIDAGDPMAPIMHEPFPNGGIINMGAYGGTAEASKSYFGKPLCAVVIAGDVNGDCIIDFKDFMIMAPHWCEDNGP